MSVTTPGSVDDVVNRNARWLTYALFFIFAVSTDAVGVIIPEVVKEYGLSLTQAGSFHYATMIAIAFAGAVFGRLADTRGRKTALVTGMSLFALACLSFAVASAFATLLCLVFLMGVAIGIFKTGALALVGDTSESQEQHTHTMNLAEGFFGLGAIAGPAIVTYLLGAQIHWTNLYVITGGLCLTVVILSSRARFPVYTPTDRPRDNRSWTTRTLHRLKVLKDPFASGFSLAIMLYVIAEAAIYVWMPTYLATYTGSYVIAVSYALTGFFVLRAGGRFLGVWVLRSLNWKTALTLFTGLVASCYLGSMALGVDYAIWLLPLSGLFMSLIYPTINSKGISCFEQDQHGEIAGVLLFFTALAAALGPMTMALLGDWFDDLFYGFLFTTACALLLFLMSLANQVWCMTDSRLE